ncbi:MAG: hypothetical protein WKF73_16685 [Nocardioidaceae bacterium]
MRTSSTACSALVESSLVRRLPGPHETRFRLLETVQEYAREGLAETGDEGAVQRRLAQYLLERTQVVQRGPDGSEAPQLLAAMHPEDADLRAALEWTLGNGHGELAARLVLNLRVYWLLEGRLTEGRMWLARVLDDQDLSPGAGGSHQPRGGDSCLLPR